MRLWTPRRPNSGAQRDTTALVAIGVAVIVANLPTLLGFFHPDPLTYRAQLSQALTPGLLGGRPTIDPSNGFTSQAIGHLAALDLLHLHWPWWNPYEGTGMPLLGETQAAALFPPTLLTAFANGQLYEHVLLELIAGICTYRLLRRITLGRAAAVAGAVAFALNGKFAWFADATVNPLPFLPMLLLGIERACDAAQTGRRGGWRLIAASVALTAYAGFPEVAYPDLLLAVVWVAWRAGCLPGTRRRGFAIRIGLGSVAGVLLSAPILMAMVDYLGHADLAGHTGTHFGSRHLPLSEAPQLLMPYIFGPLDTTRQPGLWVMVGGYLSIVLLLFAVLGLAARGRRGLKALLVAWVALVFAHMYGVPGLGSVLGALPEMPRIQFYRYATAALELPIIILAAVGLDDVRRVAARRRRLLVASLLAMAAVVGAELAAQPTAAALAPSVHHVQDFLRASVGWGLLTAAIAGAAALVSRVRLRAWLLAALVIVDAVVLFAVPEFSAPRAARLDLAPVAYLRRHLGEGRFYTLGPIRPNYGSYFGLGSLRLDDFPPAGYAHYVHSRLDPYATFVGFRWARAPTLRHELLRNLPAYRAAGVRYVLTWRGAPLPRRVRGLRLVLSTPTTRIYRVAGAAPLVSAPGCTTSSRLMSVQLRCSHPTTLIRRESWSPGWSAQIDGRSLPIRRVDGVFQAVSVPAGAHRLTFAFVPVHMDWALAALLAGCALVLVPTARRATARVGVPRAAAGPPALSGAK